MQKRATITTYIIKRRKDPRKSGVFRCFLGAYFAQFTDWCASIFPTRGKWHRRKNSPRPRKVARPRRRVLRRTLPRRPAAAESKSAQASERQPPPRKPGRGQRPTGAGEGIQLPRAEEKNENGRATAQTAEQRSNHTPPPPARTAHPGEGAAAARQGARGKTRGERSAAREPEPAAPQTQAGDRSAANASTARRRTASDCITRPIWKRIVNAAKRMRITKRIST